MAQHATDRASIRSLEKDLEKVDHIEVNNNKYANIGLTAEETDFYENFPEDKKKKMIRKIDFRLVPVLALLYLMAHIDRANIGNAKIEGMVEDLGMTGIQYNIALSLFFGQHIPYILLEVPCNILLKKFKRPSTYIGILVVSWGIVMTFTGVVKDFAGLVTCRIFLGIAEAGFFPGYALPFPLSRPDGIGFTLSMVSQSVNFLLTLTLLARWYGQRQVQTRLALFYCASALSGAFSGLLAFGIAKMDGIGGRPGWAWIFLLEGIVTVVIGAACFFIMPDTPALSGKWLTAEEMHYFAIQNMIKDGGRMASEKADKFKWSYLIDLVTDYKVYLQAWILFTASVCAYGLKFTMPSITKSMGYTSAQAQLLTIPPYVAGAISAVTLSKLADRFNWRMPFILGPMTAVLTGFCILLPLASNIENRVAACYIGVMLICIGQYPTNPAGSAWISSNLAGDSKRAMGIALNICLGNSGGILGSYMFLDSEKEKGYPTGFSIGLVFAAITLISTVVLEWSYSRINKQRDAMDEDEVRAKYTDEQLARMGDKSPFFRYKL